MHLKGSSALNRGGARTQVFLEHETRQGLYLVLYWATCLQLWQKPGFFTPLHGLTLCYHLKNCPKKLKLGIDSLATICYILTTERTRVQNTIEFIRPLL